MARRKKQTHLNIPVILVVIGVLLFSLYSLHRFLYTRSLNLSDAIVASYSQNRTKVAFPVYISIGENIRIPVVESTKVDGTLVVSPNRANHLLTSALPGEAGNIIMYGHNVNSVFGYLVDRQIGDRIDIRTNDGTHHEYEITEIRIVDPSQTALLFPTTTEVLTLYTCTGFLDSLRFVARAQPLKL